MQIDLKMNYKPRKVLLIAYFPSQMKELIRCAKLLIYSGKNYKPVILVSDDITDIDIDDFKEFIGKGKIDFIDIFGNKYANSGKRAKQKRQDFFQKHLKNFYRIWRFIYSPIEYYIKTRNKIKLTYQLFNKFKPDLIVLSEENTFCQTSIFTKIAQEKSIPSVVLPYLLANQIEFAENFYLTNEVKNLLDRIVVHFFPHWQFTYRNRKLILLPGWKALVMEMMKISPPKPWVIHSGYTDGIAVESIYMKKYYVNNGLPENKLVMTGSIVDDYFFEIQKNIGTYKKRLYKSLHFADTPLILCALPSPMLARLNYSYDNYKKLLEFWVTSLIKIERFSTIFNLHPHIDYESIKYLEKLGVRFNRQDIARFVPLCDIFIASSSSTIR